MSNPLSASEREKIVAALNSLTNGCEDHISRPVSVRLLKRAAEGLAAPTPMILFCPRCGVQHIDAPSGEWTNPPHRSHLCHGCDHIWRPADVPTEGVAQIATQGQHDSPRAPSGAPTVKDCLTVQSGVPSDEQFAAMARAYDEGIGISWARVETDPELYGAFVANRAVTMKRAFATLAAPPAVALDNGIGREAIAQAIEAHVRFRMPSRFFPNGELVGVEDAADAILALSTGADA